MTRLCLSNNCSPFVLICMSLALMHGIANAAFVVKRHVPKLVPTLTVDVAPSLTHSSPVALHQDNIVEYWFALDEIFNLSCVIKHPSYKYFISIIREQILTNGSKTEPVDLLNKGTLELNPDLKDDRLTTEDIDYTDQSANHIRISLIIRDLQLKDNGIYKCTYYQLVKQIKVVVFSKTFQLIQINCFQLN